MIILNYIEENKYVWYQNDSKNKEKYHMKITFLGTGAADCPLKRRDSMTEFRRLSSALIDDVLLIDPGPQIWEALTEYEKKQQTSNISSTHISTRIIIARKQLHA